MSLISTTGRGGSSAAARPVMPIVSVLLPGFHQHSAPPPPPQTPPDLSLVPKVYHDLGEAFSKDRARTLPPHRPYDCAIELIPGSKYPINRVSLAPAEKKAMDELISECLPERLIRPSNSPVAAGFFFVKKKEGSLRPCIDYQGLNAITRRNTYPLPPHEFQLRIRPWSHGVHEVGSPKRLPPIQDSQRAL